VIISVRTDEEHSNSSPVRLQPALRLHWVASDQGYEEIDWDEEDPDWQDDGPVEDEYKVQTITSAAELLDGVRDYANHRAVTVTLDNDESCVVFDRYDADTPSQ